jgi:hypothetical protein
VITEKLTKMMENSNCWRIIHSLKFLKLIIHCTECPRCNRTLLADIMIFVRDKLSDELYIATKCFLHKYLLLYQACRNCRHVSIESIQVNIRSSFHIQGDPWLMDITTGGDFLGLCDKRSSYKRVSDFKRLQIYGCLKLIREGKDYSKLTQ